MNEFVQRHADSVIGTLGGFDRLLFRGTLISLSYAQGMDQFLGSRRVLLKDYGKFAQGLSDRLKDHARRMADRAGRPYVYVDRPSVRKEGVARQIMDRDGIVEGLVCVLGCVEPCRT